MVVPPAGLPEGAAPRTGRLLQSLPVELVFPPEPDRSTGGVSVPPRGLVSRGVSGSWVLGVVPLPGRFVTGRSDVPSFDPLLPPVVAPPPRGSVLPDPPRGNVPPVAGGVACPPPEPGRSIIPPVPPPLPRTPPRPGTVAPAVDAAPSGDDGMVLRPGVVAVVPRVPLWPCVTRSRMVCGSAGSLRKNCVRSPEDPAPTLPVPLPSRLPRMIRSTAVDGSLMSLRFMRVG